MCSFQMDPSSGSICLEKLKLKSNSHNVSETIAVFSRQTGTEQFCSEISCDPAFTMGKDDRNIHYLLVLHSTDPLSPIMNTTMKLLELSCCLTFSLTAPVHYPCVEPCPCKNDLGIHQTPAGCVALGRHENRWRWMKERNKHVTHMKWKCNFLFAERRGLVFLMRM